MALGLGGDGVEQRVNKVLMEILGIQGFLGSQASISVGPLILI